MVALDTQETFDYIISTDRKKDNPRTFIFNYPSCREERKMVSLFEKSEQKNVTLDEIMSFDCEALKTILCGWKNIYKKGKLLPYDPEQLDEAATKNDIYEMRHFLLSEMGTSEVEKKVSALSSLADTGKSAKSVEQENVSANQTPVNP